MSPLPFELVKEIIRLAVYDLVQLDKVPKRSDNWEPPHELAPAFLLSASLVSRMWRTIAQPMLIHTTRVTPINCSGFLAEVRRQGLGASLAAVRLGRSRHPKRETYSNQYHKMVLLITSILPLAVLEFTDRIPEVNRIVPLIKHLESFNLTGNDIESNVDLLLLEGEPFANLTSLSLSCPHAFAFNGLTVSMRNQMRYYDWETNLPSLTHLTTHLDFLPDVESDYAYSPPEPSLPHSLPDSLVSITILSNTAWGYTGCGWLPYNRKRTLLDAVETLPALEVLTLPSTSWFFPKLVEACARNDVTLDAPELKP